MLDLIKKNWQIIILGLLILVAIKYLWPQQAEVQEPIPAPKPTNSVVYEEPEPPAPIEVGKPQKSVTIESFASENDKEELVEEVFVEEELPAKRNYILCEYIVSGETQSEFTGQIRLINKGTEPIYGWSVQWEFEDGSTIIDTSGVALGGNNPYTGSYLTENAEIAPKKTVTFYFTGVKAGDSAPRGVKIEGEFCM